MVLRTAMERISIWCFSLDIVNTSLDEHLDFALGSLLTLVRSILLQSPSLGCNLDCSRFLSKYHRSTHEPNIRGKTDLWWRIYPSTLDRWKAAAIRLRSSLQYVGSWVPARGLERRKKTQDPWQKWRSIKDEIITTREVLVIYPRDSSVVANKCRRRD